MNFTLKRTDHNHDGIFGQLTDELGSFIAVTLEHAYDSHNGDGSYVPKVASGSYKCVRHAPNRLPYETFELENVPDFQGKKVTGVLIHVGNFNQDSDGCILIGAHRTAGPNGSEMIALSRSTFTKFMNIVKDIDQFTLTVKD